MIKINWDSSLSIDIAEQSPEYYLAHQSIIVCTSLMALSKCFDVFIDLYDFVPFGYYQMP